MISDRKFIFLVDGQTEIRAIKDKFACDYQLIPEIRKVSCNGKDVSPGGYANAACGTILLALRSHFTFIVCIFDRESRRQSAIQLASQVKTAIINKISSLSKYKPTELEIKIIVCVPDIMFEIWIVSDIEGIKQKRELVREDALQENYEGKSGSTILKRIMKTSYKKTLHGPILFCSTRFNISKQNSNSFRIFQEIIENQGFM